MSAAAGLWSAAASARELRPLLARDAVAYLGPARSTNVGDRLLFEALGRLLPGISLTPVQVEFSIRALARLRSAPAPTPCGVLLGGGTLVGERRYRHRLERLVSAGYPLGTLGVGVLEGWPEPGDLREHALWQPLLEPLGTVPVRGPRSVSRLERVGIPATVVGDPVLVFADPLSDEPDQGLVAVNVGTSNRIAGDPAAYRTAVTETCRRLVADGWSLQFLVAWPPDEPLTRAIRDEVQPHAPIDALISVKQSFGLLRRCSALVAMKLHAAVLGVCAGTPVIMTSYQDKCDDFMESIGLGSRALPLRDIDAGKLHPLVVSALADTRVRETQAAAVRSLRATLVSAADEQLRRIATW